MYQDGPRKSVDDHRHILPEWSIAKFPLVYLDKDPMARPQMTLIFITTWTPSLIYPYVLFSPKVNFFIFLKIVKLLISKLKAHQMCFRDYKYR